jgi:GDP-L-fucose synthase
VDSLVPYTGGLDPNSGWPLFEPRDFSGFNYHQLDCRDYFRETKATDFDYALHLAAMVGGRLMIENEPLAVADDLSIDAGYWQWAKETQPRKSICFSSSAAYPVRLQRPDGYELLKESMIDFTKDIGVPDMSYGWAKLTCEYLARLAYEHHGVRSVSYRPFSGYGEDQDDTYPFPSICKRAIDHRDSSEFTVWGSGRQMRDFIHIDDCVRGVITSIFRLAR